MEETLEQTATTPDVQDKFVDGPEVTIDGEKPAEKQEDQQVKEPETTPEEPAQSKLIVRFNKQLRELSEDEARTLAQKGMLYDAKVAPVYQKMQALAKAEGTDLDGLVSKMLDQREKDLRDSLSEKIMDDAILDQYVKEQRKSWESESTDTAAEDDDYTQQMAKEFVDLKAEYPEITEFAKVDQKVLQIAAEKSMSLLSAQLYYDRQNQKQASAAKDKEEKTGKAAIGKIDAAKEEDEPGKNFKDAFWGML